MTSPVARSATWIPQREDRYLGASMIARISAGSAAASTTGVASCALARRTPTAVKAAAARPAPPWCNAWRRERLRPLRFVLTGWRRLVPMFFPAVGPCQVTRSVLSSDLTGVGGCWSACLCLTPERALAVDVEVLDPHDRRHA